MNDFQLSVLVCLLGLGIHFAMKWFEARQAEKTRAFETKSIAHLPSAKDYVKANPAQSLISVLSTASVFVIAYSMEWLNPLAAFAAGYMGHSVAENLMKQFSVPK